MVIISLQRYSRIVVETSSDDESDGKEASVVKAQEVKKKGIINLWQFFWFLLNAFHRTVE